MVDTRRQYLKIKSEVDTAMHNVIDSSMFIGGSAVQGFATNLAAYNGSKHVIPCANGTDALQIAMMALGLEPGDEVITPSFTYIATVEVVALLKLKPVFVEVDERNILHRSGCNQETDHAKNKSNCSRSSLWPCRQYGRDHEDCAGSIGLFVIEDNAQAIGNDYIFQRWHSEENRQHRTYWLHFFLPVQKSRCIR